MLGRNEERDGEAGWLKKQLKSRVLQLGVGLEACFDPKTRQAIRNDQPKKKKSEKVKLPTYPQELGFSVHV